MGRMKNSFLVAVAAAGLITLVGVSIVAVKGTVEDVRLVMFGIGSFIENLLVLWVGYRLADKRN